MHFSNLPRHIAFIMDGNRRWARRLGLTAFRGHREGLKRSREIINECKKLGVFCVTLWGFSTENWKRGKKEIDYLMRLFEKFLDENIDDFHKNGVCMRHIGRKDRLPSSLVNKIIAAEKLTKDNNTFVLCIALDYGGRDEICRAVEKIKNGECCSEDKIRVLLDTAGFPDPDLIVRTSGEMRLSGFLVWQSAYSELYFTHKCFPEFTVRELHKALREYEKRKRTYGA